MASKAESRSLRGLAVAMLFVAAGAVAGVLGDPGSLRPIFVGVLAVSVVTGGAALYALLRRTSV